MRMLVRSKAAHASFSYFHYTPNDNYVTVGRLGNFDRSTLY